jgi:hypothetical protein
MDKKKNIINTLPDTGTRTTTANKGFAIAGVPNFADTVVKVGVQFS